jgi:uncharacterized protein with von Willebrand factor type A (vWA) domain
VPPSPLLRNFLLFGRVLRAMGLPVTSARLVEVIRALQLVDIGSRQDVRNVARCILVSRREEMELFDRAFDLFWRPGTGRRTDEALSGLMEELTHQTRARQTRRPPAAGALPSRTASSTTRERTGIGSAAAGAAEQDEDQEAGRSWASTAPEKACKPRTFRPSPRRSCRTRSGSWPGCVGQSLGGALSGFGPRAEVSGWMCADRCAAPFVTVGSCSIWLAVVRR